jgi:hypothetical protein
MSFLPVIFLYLEPAFVLFLFLLGEGEGLLQNIFENIWVGGRGKII